VGGCLPLRLTTCEASGQTTPSAGVLPPQRPRIITPQPTARLPLSGGGWKHTNQVVL